MKTLPVGISAGTGRNKGYRLNRTINNKDYNFGSFQNLEHALRTNRYIDIIVADLKDAQAKEGAVSIEDIRGLFRESNMKTMIEVNVLIDALKGYSILRENALTQEIVELHEKFDALTGGKKSLRGWFRGRWNNEY